MRLLLAIIILLGTVAYSPIVAYSQSNGKIKFAKKLHSVAIKNAELVDITPSFESIGRLVAINPNVISAGTAQELVSIHAKVGDTIAKGQLLFSLKSSEIKRKIIELIAERLLEETSKNLLQSQLKIRKAKVNRAKKLRDKRALSQDTYESTKILALEVEQKLAQRFYNIKKLGLLLEQAQEDLEATKVFSPANGNITQILVKKGTFLKKGEEMATIFDQTAIEIETNIRADVASKLILGSPILVKFKRNNYLGSLRSIVKIENIRTGTRIARVSLDKPLPTSIEVIGTRFKLRVPVGKATKKLLIPKDALVPAREEQIVFIYKKGFAKKRNVVLGASFGQKIEIKSGIKAGDQVITKGNERIRPNQPVRVINEKSN